MPAHYSSAECRFITLQLQNKVYATRQMHTLAPAERQKPEKASSQSKTKEDAHVVHSAGTQPYGVLVS
jgi:hypothetical protein